MRTRYPLLFACAFAALLGSVIAVFATADQRDFNLRGYVNPLYTIELPFRIPRLGVNAELTQYDTETLVQQLERMQAAHIYWVRQFVHWDTIEPQPGQYEWAQWDTLFETLEAFPDLALIPVLVNSPAWTRESQLATAPPDDPNTFATFAAAFAERYGTQVDYYQIWDEPNLTAAWGGQAPRPVEYAALLQAAYTALHSVDTGATVIAAALAPTTETGPRNISDWQYLNDLYALGAADYMDAVAGKPYGFTSSPQDRTVDTNTLNFSRFVHLREVMNAHGDGTSALWASNWGWNSLPADWAGNGSIWGSTDSQTQIQYTLDALDRAEREWSWLGGMILYHWQPTAPPDDPVWGFAIIDQNNQPTPLYQVLVARTPQTSAADGLYPAANSYTRYSGVWTFSALGADIGWLRDSRFSFDFFGSEVGLLLRQDNYIGYLYPTLDGDINRLPRDAAGNPYIILTSGSHQPEFSVVPIADQLPLDSHTLEAVADRGGDRYALAGYAVSSGDLSQPYNIQITLGWMTVLAAAVATIITGSQMQWREFLRPLTRLWLSLSEIGRLFGSIIASVILMVAMLLTWNDATPALFRRDSVQLGLSIITAGLIYLNPALPIMVLAALVLFVLLYNRPAYGLALIVFYTPFFLFPVELYRFSFPIVELLTILTFSAWLVNRLTLWAKTRRSSSSASIRFHPLDAAVLLFVFLGSAVLLWSQARDLAVTEYRTLFIEPALFYLMFRTLPLNRQDILRVLDALLIAGFVVCILGLFLYLRGEAVITAEQAARRLASVYGSPNNVALFLGRCIPFALAFVLIPIDRTRQRLTGILLGAMLFTAILTQSVGGLFIGIPAAIAAVLLLVYRRRAIIPLLILAVLAISGFIIGASLSERFARALDFTEGTNFYRIRVWQSAITVIGDYPLTGLGLDQFLNAFRGHYMFPDAQSEPNLSHPHNILLDFWIRLGIGGVIWLIGTQIMFWRTSFHHLKQWQTEDRMLFSIQAGAIGSMVNLLAHGLIDNSVFVIDLAFIFMLLLALTAWLHHESNTRSIDAKII